MLLNIVQILCRKYNCAIENLDVFLRQYKFDVENWLIEQKLFYVDTTSPMLKKVLIFLYINLDFLGDG